MIRPDLRIKEGVVLKDGHFLPHMTAIIHAAIETAPVTTDGCVWITEGYRRIRETLDMHEQVAAFDFRCRNLDSIDAAGKIEAGHQWAARMQAALGDNYDVIAHGLGDAFHVHAEYDPR